MHTKRESEAADEVIVMVMPCFRLVKIKLEEQRKGRSLRWFCPCCDCSFQLQATTKVVRMMKMLHKNEQLRS